MKWIFALIAVCCLAMRCHATGPKDVPEAAEHEIARRGDFVVATGTVRSGLMAAALAPPADDSGKWYVYLVGDPKDVDYQKQKKIIEEDKDIRPWINPADRVHSTTHFDCRSVKDETQKNWLEGLQPAIYKYGLPMIVVQPPSSGQFGDPRTIVKAFHGLHTGKQLSQKLSEGIIAYVKIIESGQKVAGIKSDEPVGVAPPFNQNQTSPSPVAPLPIDWPPSTPASLTVDQIRAACPGCPSKFVLAMLDAKITDVEQVKIRWLVCQDEQAEAAEKNKPKSDPPPDPTPLVPVPETVCPRPENPPNPFPSTFPIPPLATSGIEMGALILFCLMIGAIGSKWAERIWNAAIEKRIGEIGKMTEIRMRPIDGCPIEQTSPINTSNAPTGWKPPIANGNASTSSG